MSKQKGNYVDGFVIVIKKKNLAAYRKMAEWGAKAWMKYGALDYYECVGDDLGESEKRGMGVSFLKLAKAGKDETVVFSWITYKSKAHRDAVNKKVEKQMDAEADKWKDKPMPFDMKKFTVGGFKVIVKA